MREVAFEVPQLTDKTSQTCYSSIFGGGTWYGQSKINQSDTDFPKSVSTSTSNKIRSGACSEANIGLDMVLHWTNNRNWGSIVKGITWGTSYMWYDNNVGNEKSHNLVIVDTYMPNGNLITWGVYHTFAGHT